MEFLNRAKFISFLNKSKFFIIFLIFGLLIFTYPMLISGFDLMPGDSTDVKVFNYLLEHSRLWLLKVPTHENLWNAPFYYPYDNTLAYSDAIMGLMPLYWILRLFWSEFSALQALFILMCILNYSAFYHLLNSKGCKLMFSPLASSLASFVFAFGLMRFYRMSHLNYYCQFYSILSLIFILKIDKNNSQIKNCIYFILAMLFMIIQFYSCFTLAFYFCIIGAFMVLISLCFEKPRNVIFEFIGNFYIHIIACFIIGGIMLIPFITHYLDVGEVRTIEGVLANVQNSFVWIRNQSILDNLLIKDMFYVNYFLKHEASASIGIFTTIFALIGIYKIKNLRWVFYITGILIFLMSCSIFDFSVWEYLYYIIPGAQGIRIVVRISFIGLILLCIALAKYVDFYKNTFFKKSSKIILILSILLICLEQIPSTENKVTTWQTYCWSKSVFQNQIREYINKIPRGNKVVKFNLIPTDSYVPPYMEEKFHFKIYEISCNVSNLAMWSAIKRNMYTTNGNTGIYRNTSSYHSDKTFEKDFYINILEFDNQKYLLGK